MLKNVLSLFVVFIGVYGVLCCFGFLVFFLVVFLFVYVLMLRRIFLFKNKLKILVGFFFVLFFVGLVFVVLNLVKCWWLLLVVCDYWCWILVGILLLMNFLKLLFLFLFLLKILLKFSLDLLLERLIELFELKDIIIEIIIINYVIKEFIGIF